MELQSGLDKLTRIYIGMTFMVDTEERKLFIEVKSLDLSYEFNIPQLIIPVIDVLKFCDSLIVKYASVDVITDYNKVGSLVRDNYKYITLDIDRLESVH